MKLITQRTIIQGVVKAWMHQYPSDHHGVGKELRKLDLDTCARSAVDAIIGNRSWTDLPTCDECNEDADVLIEVGQEPDYESRTATICTACLGKALRLAKTEIHSKGGDST